MSESDQFLRYAEEALLWVAQATTDSEKRLLLELAHTWTQAAVASAAVGSRTPPEHRAP
jgi:hypothetical protein